ncbi:transglutaminase family protein [Sandaracinobacteroides hominis]|uniref:transglutaminase family protein n=1 Tax=Sandaracinobacteroides hominis TaxID=2780086 RepID=UPI0018F550FE|nr:transglutaminase family protein [Sandaracinobacteroides hominis]
MQISIDHITTYRYTEPATGIVQKLRLTPRDNDHQQVVNWRIDVDADGRLVMAQDPHGNHCHLFYADGPVEALTLHVNGTVITSDSHGVVRGTDEPLVPIIYRRSTDLTEITPAIAAFAEPFRHADPLETLHALMLGVKDRMQFEPGITNVVTNADSALQLGRGVCQDLSQIFIAAARHLQHPARYVSGHFAASEHPEQEAAHAWAEAYIPDLGWVTFDPTHGISGSEAHIRVAVGLDSLDAAPVRGSRRGGGTESLAVGVFGRQSGSQGQSQIQSQS